MRVHDRFVDLTTAPVSQEVLGLQTPEFWLEHGACPLGTISEAGRQLLEIALVDPINVANIDQLKRVLGAEFKIAQCKKPDLETFFRRLLDQSNDNLSPDDVDITPPIVDGDIQERHEKTEVTPTGPPSTDTNREIEDAPLVRWVNSVLVRAVRERASDIHLEPGESGFLIKFRVDGELTEVAQPDKALERLIVSRIKLMARMNIAEKRLPQDGRYSAIVDGRAVDFRVSTFPTIHGESLVLRILDARQLLSLKELGVSSRVMPTLMGLINSPHGLFLVTGPTGSGKTLTIYAILFYLRMMAKGKKNIITIEDPAEFRMGRNVLQSEVNLAAGYTYLKGLEHILRHDPDVMMVGEIRDANTASIAIQAALAGRLVFSTLHTNDAPSTAVRLIDMGIEPFLVGATLRGVIAQRLVRKLCDQCHEKYQLSEQEAKELGLTPGETFFQAKGCKKCRGTGYRGRVALFEVLRITPAMVQIIKSGEASIEDIRAESIKAQTITLWEDGLEKARLGQTTLEAVVLAAKN